MNIVLQTGSGERSLEFRDLRLHSDGFNFETRLVVRSDGFQLERTFYFEPFALQAFLKGLVQLDTTLSGIARLQPLHERDYISFEARPAGHIVVSGEFRQEAEINQLLRFGFQTDQTCLRPLIIEVRKAVQSNVAV
jgi:hypothetical protein